MESSGGQRRNACVVTVTEDAVQGCCSVMSAAPELSMPQRRAASEPAYGLHVR